MIAYAARYGHQPILTELGPLTLERINAFNEGLGHWLDKERQTSPTARAQAYLASGG